MTKDHFQQVKTKVIGLFKGESDGKIMKEFVGLRAKTYVYLMDGDSERKKAKGTKKCVIKRSLKFKNYKNFLLNNRQFVKVVFYSKFSQ